MPEHNGLTKGWEAAREAAQKAAAQLYKEIVNKEQNPSPEGDKPDKQSSTSPRG